MFFVGIILCKKFLEGQAAYTGYGVQRGQRKSRDRQIDQCINKVMRKADHSQEVCNSTCKDLRLRGQSLSSSFTFAKGGNSDQCDDSQHTLHQHGTKRNR